MNKCQRKRIPWFVIPCAAVCLLHGQLSTRAGLIYYVEGDVRLDGIRVAKFDPLVRVGAGRTLDTGPDTLAELLLQPGNYFRLAGNTAVTMKSDEFASVAMELNGSATLDVSAIDPKTGIVISCGQASAEFSRPGFYRLDCGGGDGTSSIHVFRGQATVAAGSKRVRLQPGQLIQPNLSMTVRKKSDKVLDQFETWSAMRSEKLARLGRQVGLPDQHKHDSYEIPLDPLRIPGLW